MYYFLKRSNFNLENQEFAVEISNKLTKKEQSFFSLLLEKFNENKDYTVISLENFLYSKDDIRTIIDSLLRKSFKCVFNELADSDKVSREFYFGIFEIVSIEGDELIYNFSSSLRKAMNVGNIFNRVGILNYLKFKVNGTKNLYNLLCKKHTNKGIVEFELDEIKEFLNVSLDKYPRFYDFETKVLNHIARDLHQSDIFVWFEKVKDISSRGGKITGVKVHFTSSYYIEVKRNINSLIRKYAENIEDFDFAQRKLYKSINEKGYDKVEKILKEEYLDFFKEDL